MFWNPDQPFSFIATAFEKQLLKYFCSDHVIRRYIWILPVLSRLNAPTSISNLPVLT